MSTSDAPWEEVARDPSFEEIVQNLGDWEVREEQKRVFEDINSLLEKHDDVLVEAPTGWGKSLLALALSRCWESSYVLTAEKVLQEQYKADFPFAHVIKGKENYQCLYNPERNAANAPCAVISKFACPYRGSCLYRRAWAEVNNSDVVIANYHVILQNLTLAGRPPTRPLAIFDECHAIESLIYDQFSLKYDEFLVKAVLRLHDLCVEKGISVPALGRCVEIIKNETIQTLNEEKLFAFYDFLMEAYEELEDQIPDTLSDNHPMARIARALSPIRRYVDVCDMLEKASSSEEVDAFVFERQAKCVQIVPAQIKPFLDTLYTVGVKRVWMSATIGNFKVFAEMHNLSDYGCLRLKSLFPVENRKIYWCNAFNINYQFLNDERNVRKLCELVLKIVRQHQGQNGVIHAGTYKVAKAISTFLVEHGFTVWSHQDSKTRSGTLMGFKTQGGILVSPSLYQGIDLKDDLSRWQIIVKIPFDSLSSSLVRYKRKENPSWYGYRAALKVMQAYGRSVRHRDDWAVTYIIDSNFRIIKRFLSSWVMEALHEDCSFD